MSTTHNSALPRYLQEFQWNIKQRLLVIDHGGSYTAKGGLDTLLEKELVSVGTFDPIGRISSEKKTELEAKDNFQLIDDGFLGDGKETSIKHCEDASLSSVMEPLPTELLPQNKRAAFQVTKREPLETMKLDEVDELPNIDWLIMDGSANNLTILKNGNKKLKDTLMFQIHIPVMPLHEQQYGLSDIYQWMHNNGYQCYRFNNLNMQSRFLDKAELEHYQATQLASIEALFIPSDKQLRILPSQRLTQLAFLLDTAYNIHDLTRYILSQIDDKMGYDYLAAKGYLNLYDGQPDTFELTAEYSPVLWDESYFLWERPA